MKTKREEIGHRNLILPYQCWDMPLDLEMYGDFLMLPTKAEEVNNF